MTAPLTWVVGAGGLLGSQVARVLAGRAQLWQAPSVPWASADADRVLHAAARAFRDAAGDGPWQVAWCAGAGVTSTGQEALDLEVARFAALLDALDGHRGALFLASSAGGLYAGSTGAPFDETTTPRPVSPYGEAKLAMEGVARRWQQRTGAPVVVGRLSNLYGPGQDYRKPQGLVSQLCRAHLLRRPVSVFVPMDTLRDYLYVADAAALVADCLDRARAEGGLTVKVLAAQRAVSVAGVVGALRSVVRRAPQVELGSSPFARFHVRDLRLRSVVWPDLDRRPQTPLPVGVRRTLDDLERHLRAGQLR